MPSPKNNIRAFVGKINYNHEYIQGSAILHLLLTKKKSEIFLFWRMSKQHSTLFCSQPVLEIFDQDLPFNFYTDGSLEGVRAILKQA